MKGGGTVHLLFINVKRGQNIITDVITYFSKFEYARMSPNWPSCDEGFYSIAGKNKGGTIASCKSSKRAVENLPSS